MPPDRQCQIKAHEVDHGPIDCRLIRLSIAIALSTAYDFARFHSNFEEEYPGTGQVPSTTLPLPPTSREDLRLDGFLEYACTPCREGTIHLQTSMASWELTQTLWHSSKRP
ncbi:hypothetical protein TNCV_602121 [Trichonephila clavipes]|nr:hypothetical protein TNCV_602121 [Trichonephila clavipes]